MKDIEWKITGTITFLVLMGLVLIFLGYWIGIVIGSIGILALTIGWKDLSVSSSSFKIGAVTCWGKFLKTGKVLKDNQGNTTEDSRETVAVKGKVTLAPYFPFFINVVEIDMTRKEWIYDVIIFSVENGDTADKKKTTPVNVKIRLTVGPDERHINSYVKAGGDLDKIKAVMEGIPYREVQRHVKTLKGGDNNIEGLNYMEIVQQGNLISEHLEHSLNGTKGNPGIFEQKSFGIVCYKVQIEATIPQGISDSMVDAAKIVFETAARATEFEGDIAAAAKFKSELGLDGPTAWNFAVQSRLLRDNSMQRVQIENLGNSQGGTGPIQPIVVSGLAVNMGINQNKKDKKNQGDK